MLLHIDAGVVGVCHRGGIDGLLDRVLHRCLRLALELTGHLEVHLQHATPGARRLTMPGGSYAGATEEILAHPAGAALSSSVEYVPVQAPTTKSFRHRPRGSVANHCVRRRAKRGLCRQATWGHAGWCDTVRR